MFFGICFIVFGVLDILFQHEAHSWGIRNRDVQIKLRSRFGAKWSGPVIMALGGCFIANHFLY